MPVEFIEKNFSVSFEYLSITVSNDLPVYIVVL